MIFSKAGFGGAVADFEAAVVAQDAKRSGKAFIRLQETFGRAKETELFAGGPRLAAVLEQVPPSPRAVVAVLVGACVERGADAERCAPGVLAGLRAALEGAVAFGEAWAATGGGAFPVPDDGEPGEEIVGRTGFGAAVGWWTLSQWEMAAVALLNHRAVRAGLGGEAVRAGLDAEAVRAGLDEKAAGGGRGELLRLLTAVEQASGQELRCLSYALQVLDDEPLVVLHRPSATGYLLRLSGIGDNFQLLTLLADALIGGGHVAGRAPSPQEVAVCRETPGQVETAGSFELVAPDGGRLWNEGTPADIPVVDGVRLLVLDEPSYTRSWPAGRFFPGMRGDLILERALEPEETERWFARVSPAGELTG
ncbi:hypothetical protein FHX79_111638 [Streptomyces cavourensis]|uniref:hypothetical protein n=1 Tax=Streptomyces cavourensis TaxID=67258 RepID=UPI00114F2F54|nr:hypothetical protein [Streptomyces cavourensis]TQO29826.1 hypothetical protein FHX79_111638 [Streptomyces cavourensis]GGU59313.1 hypothetical protein GCM10010498_15740 [Streptomyces cavourensis]